MAFLESSSCNTCFLLQLLRFLTLFAVIIGSPTLEERPRSSLNQSYDYVNFKIKSAHYYPREGSWITGRLNGRLPAVGIFGEAFRSIFKRSDYGDNTVLVVSRDGTAGYRTIQSAVDQVPENNSRRTIIYITSGVYVEKVVIHINKPYITLQGEGSSRTIITWNDTAASAGTLMSASVVVESDNFIARDISFRNSAGRPIANQTNMQAAAFRISGDMAFLYKCSFYGHQDTLYDHSGRHYYLGCFIEGSEDFVFGMARSLFEKCWLHSIAQGDGGALVAQGKYYPGDIIGKSGFSFLRCIIMGSGKPYLGRAWGQYSTVVYSYCKMDANINPKGWYDWGLQKRDSTVYFGQYRCTGRGANTTGRVYWARELTDVEVLPYISIGFVDGPW